MMRESLIRSRNSLRCLTHPVAAKTCIRQKKGKRNMSPIFTSRSDQWKFKKYCENDVLVDRIERRHQGLHNFTYEIYHADSKHAATCFLQRIPISEIPKQHYVVVETSEGNLGKDIDGIYEED